MKNGAFPEKLLKEILEEAYLAQVDHNYDKAIYFYRTVHQADEPLTGDDHARFAYALEHSDCLDEAIHHYTLAVESNPERSNWAYNLGLAHFDRGNLAKAEESYRKVISGDPKCDKAYFALATVQM